MTCPRVALGDVLTESREQISVLPNDVYTLLTVRLHGRGIVRRSELLGSSLAGQTRRIVHEGQLLVARIDARNGAVGLVPRELGGGVVSNDFLVFSINARMVLPAYLQWFCRSHEFVAACARASEGTTNRVRLNVRRFLDIEIPLPRLTEQMRIAEQLGELAGRIETMAAARANVQTMAGRLWQAILAEVMSTATLHWHHARVGDVASIDAGWSPQCENRPANPDEWGVLRTTAVQWHEFVATENKVLPATLTPIPALAVRSGDVLVTRAGPRHRVGVVATVELGVPNLTISDKILRLTADRDSIEPRFLELCLASLLSQEHLVRHKTGLADAQVNISQAILLSAPIAYPTLDEQRTIVSRLSAIRALVRGLINGGGAHTGEDHVLSAVLTSVFSRVSSGNFGTL